METKVNKPASSWTPSNQGNYTLQAARPFPRAETMPTLDSLQFKSKEKEKTSASFGSDPVVSPKFKGITTLEAPQTLSRTTPVPLSPPKLPNILQRMGAEGEQREQREKEREVLERTVLQPKLTIGTPGDQYEQEVDQVAQKVVQRINSPETGVKPHKSLTKTFTPLSPAAQAQIQPKRLQKFEKIQKQEDEDLTASKDIASRLDSHKGGGSELDKSTRNQMESAIGADFSRVRIHTGGEAAQLNQDLGAKAFTYGANIFFNQGQYNPQSSEGKHLLAHELTHTVQQGASIQRKINISTGTAPTIQLVPDWIKKGVNSLAESVIPGYSLLNVFLGQNIITGEKVERSGVNLIKGYMQLIPVVGTILLNELQETKSLPEAGKWIQGQVKQFGINFDDISRRLKSAWDEMSILKGIEGNIKIFEKHLGPVISKIMGFSSVVMGKVKELRFEAALRMVGATQLLSALKQDPKAFKKAVDNPTEILKQFMSGALTKGFSQFKDNFINHFKGGLLGWLFGKAAEMGVEIPKELNIAGLFALIAQLVGATYQQIRTTVVKRLGPQGESIVSKLETTVGFIKDLVTKGPSALWARVKDFLGNLQEMIFSPIATLVSTEIIKAAVTKLISMLNPAGALVQLVLTLSRVVKFFIDQWDTIKSVAMGILGAITQVALNQVGAAANLVEKVMAQGMKLIISFLARILGLGEIANKVKELIKKIAGPVQKAIAKVVDSIVAQGKKLFGKGKKTVENVKRKWGEWWKKSRTFETSAGKTHSLSFKGKGKQARLEARSQLVTIVPTSSLSSFLGKEDVKNKIQSESKQKLIEESKKLEKMLGEPETESKSIPIDTSLTTIAGILKTSKILDDNALPLTKVTYETDSGRAKTVTAAPLTKNPGNTSGSPASAKPLGWNIANWLNSNTKDPTQSTSANKPKRIIDWRRVHLLSHKLHGPGDQVWNLTPTNQAANSRLEKQETQVFDEIKDGKIFYKLYKVIVEYNHPDSKQTHAQAGTWNTNQFPSQITLLKQKDSESSPKQIPIGSNLPAPDPDEIAVGVDYFEILKQNIDAYLADTDPEKRKPWYEFAHDNLNFDRIPNSAERSQVRAKLRKYYQENKD